MSVENRKLGTALAEPSRRSAVDRRAAGPTTPLPRSSRPAVRPRFRPCDRGLRFHFAENEQLLAYTKSTPDSTNVILTVVNVDPHHTQRGWIHLPLEELGIEADRSFQAHELISGARYLWNGPRNFVELNPFAMPGQIFRFRRRVRSEHDFEYFL